MNGVEIVFLLYLIIGGGSSLYHAQDDGFSVHYSKTELRFLGTLYLGLAVLLVILA